MDRNRGELFVLRKGLESNTFYALYNPENKKRIRIFRISKNEVEDAERRRKLSDNIIYIDTVHTPLSRADILNRIKAAREFNRLVDYMRCGHLEIDSISRITGTSLNELNNIGNPNYYLRYSSEYFIDKGQALMRYAINKRNMNGVRIRLELKLQLI